MTRLITKQALMEKRRIKVAEMLISHVTYRSMAEQLDVSVSCIHSDVHAILERWAEEQRPKERWTWIVREIQKLGDLEFRLTNHLDTLDVLDQGKGYKTYIDEHVKIIDRILKIMERRSRLLGLDAPSRQIHMEFNLNEILEALPEEYREQVRRELVGAAPGRSKALSAPRTS